ncbi:MAG: four helix bundle protein [Pyrinomonadaceae bacterium]|nr:four helix bundle protein [Pyrinomonadaceae bacterium]
MKKKILLGKSYAFPLRIVKLCRYLGSEHREYVLSPKCLDSGTEICSHIEEAAQAVSPADFQHH